MPLTELLGLVVVCCVLLLRPKLIVNVIENFVFLKPADGKVQAIFSCNHHNFFEYLMFKGVVFFH